MRRHRFLYGSMMAALAVMLLAAPVLAAYYAEITVTESDGNSYDMLPVIADIDIDYLADNNFIESDGRDVRVKTGSGAEVPFMLVDDKALFAAPIANDRQNAFRLSTGNSLIDDYAIVTGDGGYVTIADHANLEPGDDFEIEFSGYIDTDTLSSITAPTIATAEASIENSDVSTHNVDLPASIAAGDLLLMFVTAAQHTKPAITITWPAGWTELYYDEVTYATYGGAYKIATGAEGSTVDFTTDVTCCSAHRTYRVTGFYGAPEAEYGEPAVTSTPDPPSISPSWPTSNCLFMAGVHGRTDKTVNNYPSGYTDGGTTGENTEYSRVYTATWKTAEAATEDPPTFTMSGSVSFATWTVAIRGAPVGDGVYKAGVFSIFKDTAGYYSAAMLNYGKTVTTSLPSGDYVIIIGADGSDLYIKIDGDTKDTESLAGASVPDNSNDWTIALPYCDYFKLTTSDTLRLTYDPDDIISGTTLINETDAGTYDGTITYGSNPAGITVNMSGLETYETSYPTDAAGSQDIIRPTTAPLFDVDLDRLSHNPIQPIVALIANTTNSTERLVWLAGAFVLLFVILLVVLWKTEGQITFTAFAGLGFCIIAYILGIFPLWTIIVFAIGAVASFIWERVIAL